MYAVSARWAPALRASHRAVVRVDVWDRSTLVATLKPLGGEVTDEWATGIRRSLNVAFAPTAESVIVPGVVLRPWRGITYGPGAPEWVPLGAFPVTDRDISTDPGRTVQVQAQDMWSWIVGSEFLRPQASWVGSPVPAQIARLITDTGMWSSVSNTAVTTMHTPSLLWDRDRHQAIVDLCQYSGVVEAFIDRAGVPTIRNRPGKGAPKVLGLPLRISAQESTQNVHNVVSASTTITDPSQRFDPVVVRIIDPTHPAYPVPGKQITRPLAITGAWHSASEARIAAIAALDKAASRSRKVVIDQVVDVSIDAGDTVSATWPDGTVETGQVQTVTHPLTVDAAQTVSLVPTGGTDV